MSDPVPKEIGGYAIEGRVGGGGMAEVFRARPPPDFIEAIGCDIVAVKTLLPAYAKEAQFREMFAEEAEISTSLQHPNVVELFDFGEAADGSLFLVMEWVDGVDLGQVLRSYRRRRLRLHPFAACSIIEQALRGLHAAHTRVDRDGVLHPVVHRDVSPANILVSRAGAAKIADFGLARPLDRVRRTQPGIVKGKFAYLAPEQAFDRAVDPRTDLFAAGIVLWEALASRHLFRRDDDLQTVLLVRQAKVPDIRRFAPGLDGRLVHALTRALQADPKRRYPTAQHFADDIAAFLEEQEAITGPKLVAAVVRDVLRAEAGVHDSGIRVSGESTTSRGPMDGPPTGTAPIPLVRRRIA
ncbi:MAG: serine/threonine protein kinase [Deltaproteobacteria bacterium]|nr:serine/threonine protein kinase [Deltaproteobacteria bacterium]